MAYAPPAAQQPGAAPPPRPPRRARPGALSFLLGALVWLLILYLTIPGDILTPQDQQDPNSHTNMSDPNPVARTIKMGLLIIGVIVMLGRSATLQRLLKHTNRWFLVFLVLVPASCAWSISPGDTLARYVTMLSLVAIAGAFCLVDWHPQRFQNVVRPAVTLLLAGSIALYLYNPDLAIEHGEGTLENAWHGLAVQKNPFGQIATVGVILWMHGLLSGEVKLIWALVGLAISFTCLIGSRSSTSIFASIFVCCFMLLLLRTPRYFQRYMPYVVTTFALLVMAYALAILHLVPGLSILLAPALSLSGKDMTFSNRSEIWRIITEHIQLSPVLGSGYGAYWVGPLTTSPSYRFVQELYFYPTESHNGYLEITNDLGFVGLIVLIAYLIVFVSQSLQVFKRERMQGSLYLALFFQQAIINLSESCWLSISAGTIFSIMTLATFALARSSMDNAAARATAARAAGAWQPRRVA